MPYVPVKVKRDASISFAAPELLTKFVPVRTNSPVLQSYVVDVITGFTKFETVTPLLSDVSPTVTWVLKSSATASRHVKKSQQWYQ